MLWDYCADGLSFALANLHSVADAQATDQLSDEPARHERLQGSLYKYDEHTGLLLFPGNAVERKITDADAFHLAGDKGGNSNPIQVWYPAICVALRDVLSYRASFISTFVFLSFWKQGHARKHSAWRHPLLAAQSQQQATLNVQLSKVY